MRPRAARASAALAAALVLQGCIATRNDVVLLQQELQALRTAIAQSDSARRRDTDALSDALAASARRTDDSLRALAVRLGRMQADVNDQFRDVGRQLITIQELTGQSQRRLQELRAALEDRTAAAPVPPAGGDSVPAAPALPGPNRLFELARDQLERGSPTAARAALDTLIVLYPTAEIVGTAQFFVAEAYAAEGNRRAADSVYALVPERYPRSDRAPTALYKLAQARRAAGNAAAARPLLERIVREYPRSDEAALARDLLRAR